jgi:hypothetical protein
MLQVAISEDRMHAYLVFKNAEPSGQLTVSDLENFLHEHGVVYGIQTDVLESICRRPQDFYFSQNLVAQGDEPVDGTDGWIRMMENADVSRQKKPAEREDGSVDFKEVTRLANVKAGQLIAERVPPVPGVPGKTVTGEDIKPREGKEAHFKIGKNVVVNPEKTAMYAVIDGLITKTENDRINVFPVYEVNGDVDYNIGNIDFVGNVVVRGNILTGFRVRASGDIRVTGGIEGAEVESDGSIEVAGGIIGGNKGLVKAGKNVRCSFIQEGNVVAGEEVIVSQSIMHSNVRAGRQVICLGAKGLIVGGLTQAGERVTARMIGNTMSTATAVEVGVRPDLRQELNELRARGRQLTDSLDKTDKALALLDQMASAGQLSPERMAMRVKLGVTRRQTTEELDAVRERILEIEKSLEDAADARVDAMHSIHGGTKIVIGRYTRFIKESVQRVSFRLSDGEVVMLPIY